MPPSDSIGCSRGSTRTLNFDPQGARSTIPYERASCADSPHVYWRGEP